MNISEIFIRRPVATILLMIAIIVAGLAAYRLLPVAALPQADFPTISVSANLEGASPDTMASSVATPLIKQFQTIDGIDSISASSSLGSSDITIQFALTRDIDAAAADVQAAISRAQRQLPANLTQTPSYRKANPASQPVLFLALSGEGVPLTKMDDLAQNVIAPSLSTVSGVAQATVFGSKTYAVRVEVDPAKLAARGLSLNSITTALKAANDQTPLGTMTSENQVMTIDAPTQRVDANSFRTLIIAKPNGEIVRLGDVANVLDSFSNLKQGSWLDSKSTIVIAVIRQPAANTVQLVDAVRSKLPGLEANLPAGMKISVINDASVSIRNAVEDVKISLGITIALVVMVIFLFLRKLTATMIPGLAVPLSLLATIGAMYALGFSIDNISLLALTLSVGLVVDDAIVMLENIVRRVELGEKPLEAAIKGSAEVTGTIISMSLSLVAVFLPILLMGGIIGRVFNEFAIVVTLAILSSALISLTVTPMLAARLPQQHRDGPKKKTSFDRITDVYGWCVAWCLRHRFIIVLVFLGSAFLSYNSFTNISRSLFPTEDLGLLSISTQGRQDISYPVLLELQQAAAAAVQADPAVDHVLSFVGGGPGAGGNSASMNVQLKPKADRPPLDQTLASLRKRLSTVPGLRSFINPRQSLSFGGRSSQSQYQLVMQSLDAKLTRQWSGTLVEAMRADRANFVDVASDFQNNALQVQVNIDFDRASALGITPGLLRSALQSGFGTFNATQIQTTGNSYNVIVEYDQSLPWDENRLATIKIPNSTGGLVPLSSFASVTRIAAPVTVNQSGQLTAVTLSFNLPQGVSLGAATARIDAIKKEINLPSAVLTNYAGAALIFQQSTGNTGLLIGAAILTIYILLGVLYESFIHPLTILSGLPSAALGALLALQFMGMDLSMIALIGLLMLIGIVKKNAIMMIDVALQLTRDGTHDAVSAMQEAAVRRFRPIMMTTFCALLGTLPIALGTGASSELRQPLGVAVVGGLIISQILTLFITPVIFVEFERLSQFVRGLFNRKQKMVDSVELKSDQDNKVVEIEHLKAAE
jgi:hydrophobic/amphiphilic exporter-1 (mainly G- bacteria), HAE1 family